MEKKYYDIYLENSENKFEQDVIIFDGSKYSLGKSESKFKFDTFEEAVHCLKEIWEASDFGVVSIVARD